MVNQISLSRMPYPQNLDSNLGSLTLDKIEKLVYS